MASKSANRSKTKVIIIFNQAGGVGKTTTTQNLGYHLARKGKKVALIDLDPQASLTAFMGIEPHKLQLKQTLYYALINSEEPYLAREIYEALDLVPTNIKMAKAEMELISVMQRELRLAKVIEPLKKKYNFILIDSLPSLGLLSTIGLAAATHLLIPIETQFKSFYGTDLLLETVNEVRLAVNKDLQICGFLPTKHIVKNAHNCEVLEAMKNELSGIASVFPPIPICTALAESSEKAVPLALHPKATQNKRILGLFDHLASAMIKI